MQLEKKKEQWTIESELAQLRLEQEQRKVSELEIRLQSLLNQQLTNSQQQLKQTSNSTITTNQTNNNNQQSLNRANSNTNSLASSSGKSLDVNHVELGSISSAASLYSPTLDCFGTVQYPSIINDQSSVTMSEDIIFTELTNLNNNNNSNNGNVNTEHSHLSLESVQVLTNEYLQQRMTKLINMLQLIDSRAAFFQQECNAIQARYIQLEKENTCLQTQLSDQEQVLVVAKEEYHTSVENYEFQLRTMSEHLAEMNEKLTTQSDEIDLLKYQAKHQQQQQSQESGKTSSAASTVAKVSVFLLRSVHYIFLYSSLTLLLCDYDRAGARTQKGARIKSTSRLYDDLFSFRHQKT